MPFQHLKQYSLPGTELLKLVQALDSTSHECLRADHELNLSEFQKQIERSKQNFTEAEQKAGSTHFSIADLKPVSEPLLALLKDFTDHKLILLAYWLRDLHPRRKNDGSLELTVLSIPDQTELAELLQQGLPQTAPLRLELDLSQLQVSDLGNLALLLNKQPLHSLVIRGNAAHLPEKALAQFLESLTQPAFIQAEEPLPPSLREFAKHLTYRNWLVRLFGLGATPGLWDELIDRWSNIPTWRAGEEANCLPYLKIFHSMGAGAYSAYLKNLYKEREAKEQRNDSASYYSNDRDSFGRNHEYYTLINAALMGMGDLFFTQVLGRLNKVLPDDNLAVKNNLAFNHLLSEAQLQLLTDYLGKHPGHLPFASLTLHVDHELIQTDTFKRLLAALRNTTVEAVQLAFTLETLSSHEASIAVSLAKCINEENLNYPLTLHYLRPPVLELHSYRHHSNDFINLEKLQLAKIRAHHLARLQDTAPDLEDKSARQSEQKYPQAPVESNPFAEKLALKKLARQKGKNLHPYLQVEVQHLEVMQEEIEQEIVEQKVELDTIVEQNLAYPLYEGELITENKFTRQPYYGSFLKLNLESSSQDQCYETLRHEYFSKLPGAVQYLSPAAADILAHNLPAFLALNTHNLPSQFFLKKTARGELVLDYDETVEEHKANVFTPRLLSYHDKREPLFLLEHHRPEVNDLFRPDIVKAWIKNEAVFKTLCFDGIKFDNCRLGNLWLRYGERGLSHFFDKLEEVEKVQPGFAAFLADAYLKHFRQLDHFLDTPAFFDCLDRIKKYSSPKINCLKRFLAQAGISKHELSATLSAFDYFWSQFESLCQKQGVDPEQLLKAQWSVPPGNPVVYMERLLIILQNARSLEEQLTCLDGLSLDHNGAFYASRHEGFKLVSKEMNLVYDPKSKAGAAVPPFNAQASVYRVDLAGLIESLEEKDEKAAAPSVPTSSAPALIAAHRFIGLQPAGIKLKHFAALFDWSQPAAAGIRLKDNPLTPTCRTPALVTLLLLVSHKRYLGQVNLAPLLNELNRLPAESLRFINDNLLRLHQRGILLNEKEGLALIQFAARLHTREFEQKFSSGAGVKKAYLEKVFSLLERHKQSTLNALAQEGNTAERLAFALDTAAYLARDPDVAAGYKDDLLSFALLISAKPEESYSLFRNQHLSIVERRLDRIQAYLKKAATLAQPNLWHHAFKLLLQTPRPFNAETALMIFQEVDTLSHAPLRAYGAVSDILRRYSLEIADNAPALFASDLSDVKAQIIEMILMLRKPALAETKEDLDAAQSYLALQALNLGALQTELQRAWRQHGPLILISSIAAPLFKPLLNKLKKTLIEQALLTALHGKWEESNILLLSKKILGLSDFSQGISTLEALAEIEAKAKTVAALLATLTGRDNFKAAEASLFDFFKRNGLKDWPAGDWLALLNLLEGMPQRDYHLFLPALLNVQKPLRANPEAFSQLIRNLADLHQAKLPSHYIRQVLLLAATPLQPEESLHLYEVVKTIYKQNNEDALLKWLLDSKDLKTADLIRLLQLAQNLEPHREALLQTIKALSSKKQLPAFLEQVAQMSPARQHQTLMLFARSFALTQDKDLIREPLNHFKTFHALLNEKLDDAALEKLCGHYNVSAPNLPALIAALGNWDHHTQPFEDFLASFEKAPFGKRNHDEEFSVAEVERVVNESKDALNPEGYTFLYRRQWMEAFLLVNEMGRSLPVYYGKPAKDLSNRGIQTLFQELKRGRFDSLGPLKKKLYALALMREAMGRASGEFPYSTQMLDLIDCILHEKPLIQNIDTGQGKTMIDNMKGALAWLDSTRVHVTTSSTEDAQICINQGGAFLNILGIPYGKKPITSNSRVEDYPLEGLSFTTFPQLSLFLSKVEAQGQTLGNEQDVVSLVINESDHAILDDNMIYRFSVTAGAGVKAEYEWIYGALKDFVRTPAFKNDENSAEQDIEACREYLRAQARQRGQGRRYLDRLPKKQLLTWLESAILAGEILAENFDYVLPQEAEQKLIDGGDRQTHVAHILQEDGKVSPDAQYGNGVQQILYAGLNEQEEKKAEEQQRRKYVLSRESKTLRSTINKSVLDYHLKRPRPGLIFGSSGSVGSKQEMEEQSGLYNFEFSEMAPHQKKQTHIPTPRYFENEESQFAALLQAFQQHPRDQLAPALIFFKDIETAKRFYEKISRLPQIGNHCQLFTGVENEAEVIANAAPNGSITVTTSGLGRNTNVLYERRLGMKVYQTFVDSERRTKQKAGRTWRQGSPGEFHLFFNRSDLGGKTPEQIQAELGRQEQEKRAFNQELYNLLDLIWAAVSRLPEDSYLKGKAAFLHQAWPAFCEKTEAEYRKQRFQNTYQRQAFVNAALRFFMTEMQAYVAEPSLARLTETDLLEQLNRPRFTRQAYRAYQQPVRLADCVPPEIIAPHFSRIFNDEVKEEEPELQLPEVLQSLHHSSLEKTQRYLRQLVKTSKPLEELQSTQKDALEDFLTQASSGKKQLTPLANNRNALLLFKALTELQGSKVVSLDVLKTVITSLVKEYQSAWFVSSYKKNEAKTLIQALMKISSIADLAQTLIACRQRVMAADITTNQNSFWRHKIKPVNLKNSRFQTMLTNGLNLLTALKPEKVQQEPEREALLTQLKETIHNPEVLNNYQQSQKPDDFKLAAGLFKRKDGSSNTKILQQSLELALEEAYVKELFMKPGA